MEKFEIDLKWASYLVIVNVLVSNTVALFAIVFFFFSFEDRHTKNSLSIVLIMFFVIQLLYFVRKAIKENKKHQTIRFFSKVSIFMRILCFYLFVFFLLINRLSNLLGGSDFIIHSRKNKLLEFLVDDDEIKDNKSNWLNDLVITINTRFGK